MNRESSIPESEIPFKSETPKDQPLLPIETDAENGKSYVLDNALPYNKEGGKLVPSIENFKNFTLDSKTLEVIDKVSTAIELRDPCLLEGETATSKTSSIEYLAARTNHELVKLNLNGQTDTSELIGKYIPNDGRIQIEFEQTIRNPDLLTKESKIILEKANHEGRGLSLFESQKIASAEGIESPDWRWENGIIPEAMKNGWWVILDEINLAEPQILERINSVLERNPSLTMSEQGNTKIASNVEGENKLHNNFRMLATMNPATYAGRSPMSPAYKDRWTSYMYVDPPTQADYQAMGENLVYGEQPIVTIRGQEYQDVKTEPKFDKLHEVPNMREFLSKLAKFEVKIEEMARKNVIAKGEKEANIFTRRGLIEFFEFLQDKNIYDRKKGEKRTFKEAPKELILRGLKNYFLDKLKGEDDLKKVKDLMDAIGISEGNWTVEFSEKKEEEWLDKDHDGNMEIETKGRNPEQLIDEVFNKMKWIPGGWQWEINDEKTIINMKISYSEKMSEFIDGDDFIKHSGHTPNNGFSIKDLLDIIKDKRVRSVNKRGQWYLEIIN